MNDQQRLQDIRQRLKTNQIQTDDVSFLLALVEDRERKLKTLSQQVMELNQEIENVKADFGGDQR